MRILNCGDPGSVVAHILKRLGVRVVTTYADRCGMTRQRDFGCDIEILPIFDDVVRESDMVISLMQLKAMVKRKRSRTCAKATP